jgi:hypothetical protein
MILDQLIESEVSRNQIREFIARLDNDEAKAAIDKLKVGLLGRFRLKFDDESKRRYSTLDGVDQQLRDFIGPVGLLYFFTFVDGELDMGKMVVGLTKERFKLVDIYIKESTKMYNYESILYNRSNSEFGTGNDGV